MNHSCRTRRRWAPWRNGRSVAAALLSLMLIPALACGSSAAPEAPAPAAETAPSPTAATVQAVAEAGAATPVEPAEVKPGATESMEEASPAKAVPEPAAEAQQEPTAAAEVKPEPAPSPTVSVGDLAAIVEANPAADTVEPEPEPTAEVLRERAEGPLAAEPVGINAWINSDPLTLEQLRGKVVLVDFWTYTCVNCIRTFPFLKLWHSRYADDGLVILGVHTPEFEFEKDYANVLEATEENGIVWPVAQDNDFATWQAYENRYWPAKYLIDQDGVVRYTHFGEGKYAETEEEIRKLLEESGADLSDDVVLPEDQMLDPLFLQTTSADVTPELYAGYHRNYNTIASGFLPYVIQYDYYDAVDTVVNLVAPLDLERHHLYFHGTWQVGREHVKHGRTTRNYEDYIALEYSARSVNAVLTSDSGEPYQVRITLDGEYLTEDNAGADIHFDEEGRSFLMVDQPRLYAIIDSPTYTQGQTLLMSSNSDNFGVFAFTFGIYTEGP